MLNKTLSDIMNSATSRKCHSVTLSEGKTSRKENETLDTRDIEFIMFQLK